MTASDVLHTIKSKIKDIFGHDSLSWFDYPYIVDWIVVIEFFVLGNFIRAQQVFERDFSPSDPLIQHPHTSEQISSYTNNLIAVAVPAVLVVLVGAFRNSIHEIHHGLLAVIAGSALTRVITEALKNRVGRLRPDFLSRCQWDASQHVCTGNIDAILDGRRSFPSGHSSTAFVGMTFLTLFLAGKTAAFCFSVTPSRSFLRSRFGRLVIVLSPLAFATWVAITRIEDYRHHKEDVIVGGLIGIFSGSICYLLYWPNPFAASSFSAETMGCPRPAAAVNGVPSGSRGGDYRLAPEGPDFESV
ncbi:lipid phosphate phosphatase 1 [Russula ochroleuca]|jgi:membrane-associated phospholipid phosphatase|uniref:Lipid phosphate phosphatase 1 n=1 Tax=Russula ochroleuca TaxID=152965 RepID=A0A9P5MVL8_9AGAM|nr:lipid phosphate phosphatase 1 [Russula ochroleuca]